MELIDQETDLLVQDGEIELDEARNLFESGVDPVEVVERRQEKEESLHHSSQDLTTKVAEAFGSSALLKTESAASRKSSTASSTRLSEARESKLADVLSNDGEDEESSSVLESLLLPQLTTSKKVTPSETGADEEDMEATYRDMGIHFPQSPTGESSEAADSRFPLIVEIEKDGGKVVGDPQVELNSAGCSAVSSKSSARTDWSDDKETVQDISQKEVDSNIIKSYTDSTRHVLFPDNKFLLYWDLMILVFIVFIVMYIPFQIGVSDGQVMYQTGYAFLVFTLMNVLFMVDVALNFHRAYVSKQNLLVYDRKKIVRNYIRGWFVIDVIACVPVDSMYRFVPNDFLLGQSGVNLISFFNLLRIFRLNRATKIVRSNSHILHFRLRNFSYGWEVARIVMILVVFGHWIGCMFCYVALLEAGSFSEEDLMDTNKVNWLQVYELDYGYVQVVGNSMVAIMGRYTLGLYWAFTTTTSIGYGDITPKTIYEIWYVSLVMLMAGLVWSWVIGQIISLVEAISRSQILFRSRLVQLNHLLHHFQEDAQQVRKDSRIFLFQQYQNSMAQWDSASLAKVSPVMDQLPTKLRNRVCLALIRDNINHVSYFRHPSIQTNTLAAVASLCEIEQFDARDIMFMERDPENNRRGIYILRTGVIAVVHSGGKQGSTMRIFCRSGVVMHDFVLLPKSSELVPELTTIGFLTYTEVVFVPRRAIRALFEIHPRVWKDSGRWCALRIALILWARTRVHGRGVRESEDIFFPNRFTRKTSEE